LAPAEFSGRKSVTESEPLMKAGAATCRYGGGDWKKTVGDRVGTVWLGYQDSNLE
jgi:hypothetical protein